MAYDSKYWKRAINYSVSNAVKISILIFVALVSGSLAPSIISLWNKQSEITANDISAIRYSLDTIKVNSTTVIRRLESKLDSVTTNLYLTNYQSDLIKKNNFLPFHNSLPQDKSIKKNMKRKIHQRRQIHNDYSETAFEPDSDNILSDDNSGKTHLMYSYATGKYIEMEHLPTEHNLSPYENYNYPTTFKKDDTK